MTTSENAAADAAQLANHDSAQYALVAQSVVVNSEDDYQVAATALVDVKSRFKKVDALRREFVDPLNAHVSQFEGDA